MHKIYWELTVARSVIISCRENHYREENRGEIQNFRKKFKGVDFIQNCVQIRKFFLENFLDFKKNFAF